MAGWRVWVGCGVAAVALGGCSVATSTVNTATTTGGAVVGSLGSPIASPPPAAPPAAPPAMGAFLEGPIGTKLGDADRDRAYQAELDALAAGDRKTWRGVKGNFGYVTLTGVQTPEGCRDFSHTVYLSGRPQTGKGTGCRLPDGTWHITG